MRWRSYIPAQWRLQYQLVLRRIRDQQSGLAKQFARDAISHETFTHHIALTQVIRPSHLYENKLKNIELAGECVAQLLVKPGEVFSFWEAVGAPIASRGYLKGRNLVNGKLQEAYGGGLCQLSGMIYHLALLANLEILERYHHSKDIYTEETRYTPLGADATVVFGYKDLRFRNPNSFPLRMTIEVGKEELSGKLWSTKAIIPQEIRFERLDHSDRSEVFTKNGKGRILAHSVYLR